MISVCIITRNEEAELKKCLQTLSQYPFEIVIVDTGSTDCSLDIAHQYSEHVYSYRWKDDFSDARNYASSKASNDEILMIDTDEIIIQLDYTDLEQQMQLHRGQVGRVERINLIPTANETMRAKEWIQRLYDRRFYEYKGTIHEQIVSKQGVETKYYQIPIVLEHSGYNGSLEEVKKKADRNIKLLLKELKEQGDDPYILYQLGKSYYMSKDDWKACEYFEQAICYDLDPALEYVIDLIITYGYALLHTEQYEKAAGYENLINEFGGTADFHFLLGLIYMNLAKFDQAVAAFLKATQISVYMVEGVTSYKSYYNIGVIYECLSKKEQAMEYYRKCEDYYLSKQGIRRLLGQ